MDYLLGAVSDIGGAVLLIAGAGLASAVMYGLLFPLIPLFRAIGFGQRAHAAAATVVMAALAVFMYVAFVGGAKNTYQLIQYSLSFGWLILVMAGLFVGIFAVKVVIIVIQFGWRDAFQGQPRPPSKDDPSHPWGKER